MAERHAILNSRAIETLLQKDDRISRMSDGFGDFCFFPKPENCLYCGIDVTRPLLPSRFWDRELIVIDDEEVELIPSLNNIEE
jgi:hypothetical protein